MTIESSETTARTPQPDEGALRHARAKKQRRKALRAWLRRALWLLVALGAAAVAVRAARPKPTPVQLGVVTRGALRVTVDEEGRARVADRYSITAPRAGFLSRVTVRPGDRVARGAPLARLEPMPEPLMGARDRAATEARANAAEDGARQARANVDRVRTALEYSRRRATRTRELAARGAMSQVELEQTEGEQRSLEAELAAAQAAVRVAGHEVEVARAALGGQRGRTDATEVLAPVTGVVLRVLQQSEGPVTPGLPLIEIGDPSAFEIVVAVLTADAVRVRERAAVTIEGWGGPQALAGLVRRVEPSAFTRVSALGVEEQRVNVLVDISDPRERWSSLGDGYRVAARISLWEADSVLRAASSALFRRGDQWCAFVVRDGVARVSDVQIGERAGAEVQVLRGLAEGDRVILHPSDKIADGTQVTADE
ncbi:MAG: HlyD family efflux transporter periplasmic adaptor subunit [Myxococcales bacterium]|nr:HlyD family efflux transporter periplasmic adaptor subunit [Myxococcales bacterium]